MEQDKVITLYEPEDEYGRRTIDLREILGGAAQVSFSCKERFMVVRVGRKSLDGEDTNKDYIVESVSRIPLFQANEWLDTKNANENTGKKYANILCRFLNYLDFRNLEYWDVTNNVVEDYILYRLTGGKDNVTLMRAKIKYKTIKDDVNVIQQFYKWLSIRILRIDIKSENKKNYKQYTYLFAEIGEADYETIIKPRLDSMDSSREYIKWYTDEEIEAICSNFTKTRDKAIFLCTVDGGLRIDEALSIKISDYDANQNIVTPSRSKTKVRAIKLTQKTCDVLNNYILGERADAEYESGRYSEFMFLNINKGASQGKPMGYLNFYKILKKAAGRAGLPEELIRTHSGRSTKAMEYLKIQARNPELNLTDKQIATNMGWSDIRTIDAYRDRRNEELAMMAQEKIQQARENYKNKDK